jgi:uncharacterized protein (TIGR00299 family) protein
LKIAYLDCFSGISGDMCLGAIVDAGVSLKELNKELEKIPVKGYELKTKRVKRANIIARKVDVIQKSEVKSQNFKLRRWKDIEEMINNSSLSKDIKQKGLNIFKRLFEVEAKVHGESFDKVHLHELGAIDCIVDIFGTIIGLEILGVEKVYASPINLGTGSVNTVTGILPVPAPATAEILKNVPVYSKAVSFELTTPTGAALIKEVSTGFGDIPVIEFEKIGIGAGSKNFKDWPNVLRILIGNSWNIAVKGKDDMVTVIETNIDDMNPQIFEYVIERLYKAGALDVYLTQVIMKKGRPGVILTVLCNNEKRDNLIKIILRETSTIGLRFYEAKRRVLKREIKKIDIESGKVRVKISRFGEDILKTTLEYEDCKRIAKKLGIPLLEVMKKIK